MTNGAPLMYEEEFGSDENAVLVHNVLSTLAKQLDAVEPATQNIVDVVKGGPGQQVQLELSQREVRIIRFAVNRALETF